MKIFKCFLLLILIMNFAYAHTPTSGEKKFRDNAIKKYNIDKNKPFWDQGGLTDAPRADGCMAYCTFYIMNQF